MAVETLSRHAQVEALLRQRRADDQNAAAKAHLNYASFRVPVDKGNLQKTLQQTQEATADNPRAVVQAGGVTPEGFVVNYAAPVNYGSHHVSPNGTEYSIPPNPFWTEANDVGRQAIIRRQAMHKFDDNRNPLMQSTGESTYGLEQ